jgi:hypothetical protein
MFEPIRLSGGGMGIAMDDWMHLTLKWGAGVVSIILLILQIYTYRRTRRYSLGLLAVGNVMALLSFALARILYLEVPLYPGLRAGIFDALVAQYCGYMVVGIWGAIALFCSYIRLTDVCRVTAPPR